MKKRITKKLWAKNDQSRSLNPNRFSSAPRIDSVVATLLEVLGLNRHHGPTLKLLILDLYAAHNEGLWIGYSRRKSDYSKGGHYEVLSYAKLIRSVDALGVHGFLEMRNGSFHREINEGRRSRMRATPKLIDVIEGAKVSVSMVSSDRRNEIVLHDADGKEITYEDTRETKRMREKVRLINALLGEATIALPLSPVQKAELRKRMKHLPDYTAKTVHRVFNNVSFEQGGRFYGHWVIGVPGEFRRFIQIDDEPIVELDFKEYHPTMLYHRVGASLPMGGAYCYPGADPDQRNARKAILNTLLNATDERKALAALRAKEEIRSMGLNSNEKLKPIIEAMKAHNEPISHFFNAGVGLELQYLDSQVAERILIDLADKHIACIPIHDSFIVKARHEAELREAMARATHEVIGVLIPIDRKCGPVRCEPAGSNQVTNH